MICNKTIKAKMKKNLIMEFCLHEYFNYKGELPHGYANELIAIKGIHGFTDYFEVKSFLKSIEGKEVELITNGYGFFEKNNNNYELPAELWSEL